MPLKKINFLPMYSKDKNDLYYEFYKPSIENSIQYDRITGYFGSGIFVVITDGLKTFIKNNGKIRIICSPVMSEEDYEAIVKGYEEKAKTNITNEILKEIEKMSSEYEKPLNLLSNLIKYGFLEIKIAVFKGNNNSSFSQLMHDKIGLFTDVNNNIVAFGGSMNETYSGISNEGNLESFSVFTNWEGAKDKLRVESYNERFKEIWNNESKSVITFDFPEEASSLIRKYSTDVNINDLLTEVISDNKINKKTNDRWYAEKGENRRTAKPHQIKVLDNWYNNGRRGIFEMATGSGKTFTSLCAIRDSLNKNEIPLIIVPSSILLNQWKDEVEKVFSSEEDIKILLCGSGNNGWKKNDILSKFTSPKLNIKRIIISTIQTAHTDEFINKIIMSDILFLIVDEVHRSGSSTFSSIFKINSGPRIGLSATPKRFRDEEGTNKIKNYFENEIEPKYSLFQAIADGNLTPYNYFFSSVHLTEDEQIDWNKLTLEINKKVARQFSNSEIKDLNIDKSLEMLLIKRARIVKKAFNKINSAVEIIKKHYKEGQSWLVYCEDEIQLRTMFDVLGELGFRRFYYISDMASDKEETLKTFEKVGGILVSIKCLDEGVDIPSISHALILASSTNPREYIQRRGRVLRKSENKDISYIFDCITLPNQQIYEVDENKGLSIIKSEIARSLKFAEYAENKIDSIYNLNKIVINYDIDLEIDGRGGFENE